MIRNFLQVKKSQFPRLTACLPSYCVHYRGVFPLYVEVCSIAQYLKIKFSIFLFDFSSMDFHFYRTANLSLSMLFTNLFLSLYSWYYSEVIMLFRSLALSDRVFIYSFSLLSLMFWLLFTLFDTDKSYFSLRCLVNFTKV